MLGMYMSYHRDNDLIKLVQEIVFLSITYTCINTTLLIVENVKPSFFPDKNKCWSWMDQILRKQSFQTVSICNAFFFCNTNGDPNLGISWVTILYSEFQEEIWKSVDMDG